GKHTPGARRDDKREVGKAQAVAHAASRLAGSRLFKRAARFGKASLEEERAAQEVKRFGMLGRASERRARRALREAEVVALQRIPRGLHGRGLSHPASLTA